MTSHISSYANEANQFFKEIAKQIGEPENIDQAFRITRAVLHSLRKRITPEESMHVISQLPMIVKGIYVDGWKISEKIKNVDGLSEFLEEIREQDQQAAERDFPDDQHLVNGLFAVLRVMRIYVDEGEAEDIRSQLPPSLAPLFV